MENPNLDGAAQTPPTDQGRHENTSPHPSNSFLFAPSFSNINLQRMATKVAYLPESAKSDLITEAAANHSSVLYDLLKLLSLPYRQTPLVLPGSLSVEPRVVELARVVARDESRKIYVHILSGETSMNNLYGAVREFGDVEALGFCWSTTLATVKYFDPRAARRAIETPVEVMNRHHLRWHSLTTVCSICQRGGL
ncbi:regulator of ribonuclease activity A [Striga asiatica]|uniref:Regulator of ribonuclease activity A n=1 Tax=Striga asiatica TaxID=4170 RepID=A0A5A7PG19_STRAF|nr:regulator of ribonuclease activity A [Striga asiatica]